MRKFEFNYLTPYVHFYEMANKNEWKEKGRRKNMISCPDFDNAHTKLRLKLIQLASIKEGRAAVPSKNAVSANVKHSRYFH